MDTITSFDWSFTPYIKESVQVLLTEMYLKLIDR